MIGSALVRAVHPALRGVQNDVTFVEPPSCDNQSSQPEPPRQEPDYTGDPPPFRTAQAAIRFAVTREGSPSRPLASRMATRIDVTSGRRDFVGLDAAAQAGMILSVLESLGREKMSILIAETAPKTTPCHCRAACCSGRRANRYWRDAIATLAQETAKVFPPRVRYALRAELLVKLFSKGGSGHASVTLKAVADDLEIDVDTVSKHHKAMVRWLNGAPASKQGDPPVEGASTAAWREAEDALRMAGIVG